MTDDDLTALIGPPAPDRVRTVMGPRGPQPPRIHPEYRAWLDAPYQVPPDRSLAAQGAPAALIAVALVVALLVIVGAVA